MPRTCKMLTGYSSEDATPDVECGKPATHELRNDPAHVCCAECYAAMADDAELAAEYRPIAEQPRG